MNIPTQPTSQHDGIVGPLPTIWYGTTALSANVSPWVDVGIGSTYLLNVDGIFYEYKKVGPSDWSAGAVTVDIATLAALAASAPVAYPRLLRGRNGGLFTYDSTLANRADGGMVFDADDGTGQFRRLWDGGWLNAQWFGALGNRSTTLLSSLYSTRAEVEARWPLLFDDRYSDEWTYFDSTYGFTWASDWGNATLDWIAIQSALLRCRPHTTYADGWLAGGGVLLPTGTYTISLPLVMRIGSKLTGHAPYFEDDNWPSSHIKIVPGSNIDGIITRGVITSEYCHALEISDLMLEGDRNTSTGAQVSTTGSGIVISRMGEVSTIDRVSCWHWAENGIEIIDIPTPGHIGKVSLFRNYGSGMYVSGGGAGQLVIEQISGDNNRLSLLRINNFFKSSLIVHAIKAERSNVPDSNWRGHPDIVWFDDANGVAFTLGTMFVEAKDAANPGNSLFKMTTSRAYITVYGNIVMRDTEEANYTYGVDNQFLSSTATITTCNNIGPFTNRAYTLIGTGDVPYFVLRNAIRLYGGSASPSGTGSSNNNSVNFDPSTRAVMTIQRLVSGTWRDEFVGRGWEITTTRTLSANISEAATTTTPTQFVDPNGSDRTITLTTPAAGCAVNIYHVGGANTLTFDPSGIAHVLNAGEVARYIYTGTAWAAFKGA